MILNILDILYLHHYVQWLKLNKVKYPIVSFKEVKKLIDNNLLVHNYTDKTLTGELKEKRISVEYTIKRNSLHDFDEFTKSYTIGILQRTNKKDKHCDFYITKNIENIYTDISDELTKISIFSVLSLSKVWKLVNLQGFLEIIDPYKIQSETSNDFTIIMFAPYLQDQEYILQITGSFPTTGLMNTFRIPMKK